MALKTKGITKKTFRSGTEAIEWAEGQYKGGDKESQEELARFRLMAGNVPRDFWTSYSQVIARFDPEGAVDYFAALDEDGDEVRRY